MNNNENTKTETDIETLKARHSDLLGEINGIQEKLAKVDTLEQYIKHLEQMVYEGISLRDIMHMGRGYEAMYNNIVRKLSAPSADQQEG